MTDIHHIIVMHWIREAGLELANALESGEMTETIDLDELQRFLGNKRNQIGIGTVVKHWRAKILAWVVGDRSIETFKQLRCLVKGWQSFWSVTHKYDIDALVP